MKKVFIIISIILIGVIVFMGVKLHLNQKSLEQANESIARMSFVEGEIYENKTGGLVTTALKTWVYFQDDTFINSPSTQGTSIEEIFCSLHEAGLVDSFKGNLAKMKYSKQIIVKCGNSEKSYYLVGDYYITCK